MAGECLDQGFLFPNVPELRGGVAGARDEGLVFVMNRDAHDIPGMIIEGAFHDFFFHVPEN